MKKEARAVLEIMARNQRTRRTGKWKSYMLMPEAIHEYRCPATRIYSLMRDSCKCGADQLQKEFNAAWKLFVKAVKR
jgi:hypothetical protein